MITTYQSRKQKQASKARLLQHLKTREQESQATQQPDQTPLIAQLVRKMKLMRITLLSLRKRATVWLRERIHRT